MMNIRRIAKSLLFTLAVLLLTVTLSMLWINVSTADSIYAEITDLPHNTVGLVPGCNKYISQGVINTYYSQRIDAAVKLYNAGKIDYILVSGDNAHPSYDEPREMKNSLIEAGVPKEVIYSDYAGFRTLDTIIRSKEVFQLNSVTFISQSFQNRRGIFIGKNRKIDIVAFNADETNHKINVKIAFREGFAKIKMLLDLFIIGEEPKFLGDPITIGEEA